MQWDISLHYVYVPGARCLIGLPQKRAAERSPLGHWQQHARAFLTASEVCKLECAAPLTQSPVHYRLQMLSPSTCWGCSYSELNCMPAGNRQPAAASYVQPDALTDEDLDEPSPARMLPAIRTAPRPRAQPLARQPQSAVSTSNSFQRFYHLSISGRSLDSRGPTSILVAGAVLACSSQAVVLTSHASTAAVA